VSWPQKIRYRDAVVCVALAATAALASWQGSRLAAVALDLDAAAVSADARLWFGVDTASTLRRLTIPNIQQDYTPQHPLAPLVLRMPLRVFLKAFPDRDPVSVVRLLIAAAAALIFPMVFATLRVAGCVTLDAALFSLLALASAAAMFWFTVPNLFALAALTILPAIVLVAAAPARKPEWLSTAIAALTASLMSANAVVGMLALSIHDWRRTIQIAINAFCIIAVLWGVQYQIYPRSTPQNGGDVVRGSSTDGDASIGSGSAGWIVLNTIVMPKVNTSPINYQTPLSLIAVAAWVGILVTSVICRLTPPSTGLRRFLLAVIAGQLILCLTLREPFVQAMALLPSLIVLGALGTLGTARFVVRGLLLTLLITASVNNWQQWTNALDRADRITKDITR
jgi:hypothetical protein